MLKISKISLGLFLVTTPFLTVISCSNNKGLNNGETFNFQNIIDGKAKIKKIDVSKLMKKNVTNYTGNISKQFDVDYLVGGFGEERHIYGKVGSVNSVYSVYHLGDDIFMASGTKILAPFKCEVVAAYWKRRPDYRPAEGLGGIVILRVKVSDVPSNMLTKEDKEKYKIKSPNLYIGIGHLSKKTVSDLTPNKQLSPTQDKHKRNVLVNTFIDGKNTIKLSKGQPFAEVGIFRENGGWIPHIHVQIYRGGWEHETKIRTENDFEYIFKGKPKLGKGWDNWIKKYRPVRSGKKTPPFMGVIPTYFSKPIKNEETGEYDKYKKVRFLVQMAINRMGLIPPNVLFHLYNENTPVVIAE